LKPRIVLSGVNFTEMGPLTVLREAIASLVHSYHDSYDIIALVHSKSLFDIPGVTFIEYPQTKSSWIKRLRFEYFECRRISETIKPRLWFAMHDITPNVTAEIRAVYCHNPSAFYSFSVKEALLDWKFGLFTLLYRFLYRINIKSNDFVVVQQDWMRSMFQSRYGVNNVVVAHPSVQPAHHPAAPTEANTQNDPDHPYKFFYPAYPRTFKNIEQILNAARELERGGFSRFQVWLTIDGTETRYATALAREFSDLATVKWLGLLPRAEVMRLYEDADCLIFPSKLETWGLPITEFKVTRKPILAAHLPYAHETLGEYGQAAFFNIDNASELAAMMKRAALGEPVFHPTVEQPIAPPFSRNWDELWKILLPPARPS